MKNANAAHSVKESHSIDWENARIIDREQNWKHRRIKESLYIRSTDNYNLDSGNSCVESCVGSPDWTGIMHVLIPLVNFSIHSLTHLHCSISLVFSCVYLKKPKWAKRCTIE